MAPEWPAPEPTWHPFARDWFESLGQSGQRVFYEASDVQTARVAGEVLSRLLDQGRVSAQLLASWTSLSASLLVTEGDRRRARLELERAPAGESDEAEPAGVSALDDYRRRLSG